MTDRDLDLVLFGATGFTGGLTADYLAGNAPDGLRWALAGRSLDRLLAVRDRLAAETPRCADLPLLIADADDFDGLADIARRTRVVATSVGPYLRHGEPLVAACAATSTDYVDLSGEPEFVDLMYLRHHERAVATGARLVHACGFDSVPHDLGALFTVSHLPADLPIALRGVVRSTGSPSGGTFHSALGAMSRLGAAKETARARRELEAAYVDDARSARSVAGKPHRDPMLGYWLLPLPTIDPVVVARSAAALDAYGPRFRYSHYAGTKTLRYAVGGAATVAFLAGASRIGPLRERIQRRLEPGDGPPESRRAKAWFTVDFVAEADGSTLHTRVCGGDPYTESAKMLAESALCLVYDDNPATAGQVTTAQAMGAHLLTRLQAAGMRFEVVEEP